MCLRRSTRIEVPGWLENSPCRLRVYFRSLPPPDGGTRRASSALQREVIQRRAIVDVSSVRFPPASPQSRPTALQGMPAMHLSRAPPCRRRRCDALPHARSRTAAPPPCAATPPHAPPPPPLLTVRSFTHAPARSRCCHIARHNLVSPVCPLPTPTCAVVRTHL